MHPTQGSLSQACLPPLPRAPAHPQGCGEQRVPAGAPQHQGSGHHRLCAPALASGREGEISTAGSRTYPVRQQGRSVLGRLRAFMHGRVHCHGPTHPRGLCRALCWGFTLEGSPGTLKPRLHGAGTPSLPTFSLQLKPTRLHTQHQYTRYKAAQKKPRTMQYTATKHCCGQLERATPLHAQGPCERHSILAPLYSEGHATERQRMCPLPFQMKGSLLFHPVMLIAKSAAGKRQDAKMLKCQDLLVLPSPAIQPYWRELLMGYAGPFNVLLVPIPLLRGNGRRVPLLEGTWVKTCFETSSVL